MKVGWLWFSIVTPKYLSAATFLKVSRSHVYVPGLSCMWRYCRTETWIKRVNVQNTFRVTGISCFRCLLKGTHFLDRVRQHPSQPTLTLDSWKKSKCDLILVILAFHCYQPVDHQFYSRWRNLLILLQCYLIGTTPVNKLCSEHPWGRVVTRLWRI